MTDARSAITPGLLVSDRSFWPPRFSRDAGWILRIFRAACVLFVLFASNMRTPSLDFAWSLYDRGAAAWQSGNGVPPRPRPAPQGRPAPLSTAYAVDSKTANAASSPASGSEAK